MYIGTNTDPILGPDLDPKNPQSHVTTFITATYVDTTSTRVQRTRTDMQDLFQSAGVIPTITTRENNVY